jgi:hypothetical protein
MSTAALAAEFGWFGLWLMQPQPHAKLCSQRTCFGLLGATTPQKLRPLPKIGGYYLHHPNPSKSSIQEREKGSMLVKLGMAVLSYLGPLPAI